MALSGSNQDIERMNTQDRLQTARQRLQSRYGGSSAMQQSETPKAPSAPRLDLARGALSQKYGSDQIDVWPPKNQTMQQPQRPLIRSFTGGLAAGTARGGLQFAKFPSESAKILSGVPSQFFDTAMKAPYKIEDYLRVLNDEMKNTELRIDPIENVRQSLREKDSSANKLSPDEPIALKVQPENRTQTVGDILRIRNTRGGRTLDAFIDPETAIRNFQRNQPAMRRERIEGAPPAPTRSSFSDVVGFNVPIGQIDETFNVQPGPIAQGIARGAEGVSGFIQKGIESDLLRPSDTVASKTFAPGDIRWWTERGTEQLGQLAGQISTALIARRFGPWAQSMAFAGPAAGLEGGQVYDQVYETLVNRGVDEGEARQTASMAGTITGAVAVALERVPGEELLSGPSRRMAGRFAAGALSEGGTEAAQSLSGSLIQSQATGERIDPQQLRQEMLASAALGAGAGGVANVAMGSRGQTPPRPDTVQNPETQTSPEEKAGMIRTLRETGMSDEEIAYMVDIPAEQLDRIVNSVESQQQATEQPEQPVQQQPVEAEPQMGTQPVTREVPIAPEGQPSPIAEPQTVAEQLGQEAPETRTRAQIKEELTQRGLPTQGSKSELAERLQNVNQEQTQAAEEPPQSAVTASEQPQATQETPEPERSVVERLQENPEYQRRPDVAGVELGFDESVSTAEIEDAQQAAKNRQKELMQGIAQKSPAEQQAAFAEVQSLPFIQSALNEALYVRGKRDEGPNAVNYMRERNISPEQLEEFRQRIQRKEAGANEEPMQGQGRQETLTPEPIEQPEAATTEEQAASTPPEKLYHISPSENAEYIRSEGLRAMISEKASSQDRVGRDTPVVYGFSSRKSAENFASDNGLGADEYIIYEFSTQDRELISDPEYDEGESYAIAGDIDPESLSEIGQQDQFASQEQAGSETQAALPRTGETQIAETVPLREGRQLALREDQQTDQGRVLRFQLQDAQGQREATIKLTVNEDGAAKVDVLGKEGPGKVGVVTLRQIRRYLRDEYGVTSFESEQRISGARQQRGKEGVKEVRPVSGRNVKTKSLIDSLTQEEQAEYTRTVRRLKRRLKSGASGEVALSGGVDPEIFSDAIRVGTLLVKAGSRRFASFSRQIVREFGESIIPYLRNAYTNARYSPDVEDAALDMDSVVYIDSMTDEDVRAIAMGERDAPEPQQMKEEVDTGGPLPEGITSARTADIRENRERVGLDEVPSPERQSREQWMKEAIAQGVPDVAPMLIDNVLKKSRAFTHVETEGVLLYMAKLHKRMTELQAKVKDTTLSEADRELSDNALHFLEGQYDDATRAMIQSGTEAGRNLASRKSAVNENFDLVSLKARGRTIKEAALSEKETRRIERMAARLAELETQNGQLKEAMEKTRLEEMVKQRKRRSRSQQQRTTELNDLVARANELITNGCLIA